MSRGSPQRAALVDLAVNVVAPTVVLLFLSGESWLGPTVGLLVALSFPLGHAATTLVSARRVSPLAALGVVSVLLTGGIGLLELDVRWFALKEALFPLVIGFAIVVSVRTRWPAIPTLLDSLIDGDKLSQALGARGEAEAHAKALVRSTWQMGGIFVLSAVGTLLLARLMVTSPTGTEAFTTELGRYTAASFPAIGLTSTAAMMVVLRGVLLGIERRSGVSLDDLLREP